MRLAFIAQGFGQVMPMLFYRGGMLALYALRIGAGNIHLGILSALNEGSYLYIYLVSPWIARVGKRRWMATGLLITCASMLGLFAVQPIYRAGGSGPALIALLVVMFVINTAMNIAMASWWPLVRDIIPPDVTGLFFGRLRTIIEGVGLVGVLALSVFLGAQPATWKFSVAFAVSAATHLVRALGLSRLPDPVGPDPHTSIHLSQQLAALKRPLLDRRFMYFCLTTLALYACIALPMPLYVPFLNTSRGLPTSLTVAIMAGLSVGNMLSLIPWGRYADRHSARRVFLLSCLPLGALQILLALTPRYALAPAGALILPGFCFVGIGIGLAGFGIAYTTYVFHATTPENSSVYMGLFLFLYAIGAIAGPLAGGALADTLAGTTLRVAGVTLDNYQMLLAAGGALLLPATALARGLR